MWWADWLRRWRSSSDSQLVMPGLVPGIHVLLFLPDKDVDGRDKPGHDELSQHPDNRAHQAGY
jgi:hypothetical protein